MSYIPDFGGYAIAPFPPQQQGLRVPLQQTPQLADQLAAFGMPGPANDAANMSSLGGVSAANMQAPSGTIFGLNQNQIGMIGGLGQALASFGGIYSSLKGLKQAQRAFDFNKGVINTNLENSITDHNRRLNDLASSRAAYYGKQGDEKQAFINDYTGRWEARDRRKDNR